LKTAVKTVAAANLAIVNFNAVHSSQKSEGSNRFENDLIFAEISGLARTTKALKMRVQFSLEPMTDTCNVENARAIFPSLEH
jgi:hypothetical protein